jgi:fumarylacetoacetate (FAA) hydrolase
MKFFSYRSANGSPSTGLFHEGRAIDLAAAAHATGAPHFPALLDDLIRNYTDFSATCQKIDKQFKSGSFGEFELTFSELHLLPPVLRPASCRDGYAFRQHVFTARRNRGVEMIPEFDQYPIFYFTNHHAIIGPGDVSCLVDHFHQLDFELEAAVVIGKGGRNIEAHEADNYIFGYTIMNDFSARVLQMEEMKLNLGPAKGKDFATTIGPLLVTPDELDAFRIDPPAGHTGNRHNLKMRAFVNGEQVSEGNLGDMDWTFAEIIERCAYGVDLHPTEVIGSGTVGTGCFLELNGTAKLENPDHVAQWLQPNDVVELEIDQLGRLTNRLILTGNYSLLAKKKH